MTKTPSIASVDSIRDRITKARQPYKAPKPDRPSCAFVVGRNGVAVAVMSDAEPTPERILQSQEIDPKTGEVYGGLTTEKTMVDGEVRHPRKVLDDLDRMKQKRQLSEEEWKQGRKFRDEFDLAGLDPLKASDPGRAPAGKAGSPSERIMWAKDYVNECIRRVGGHSSPTGLALWWVVGDGLTHTDAARRIGPWVDKKHVAGLVIAALGVLAMPKR